MHKIFFAALIILTALSFNVFAEEIKPVVITIENHHFTPNEIHIPAGKKAMFLVKNLDATPEEFESAALKIEKVIAAKSEGKIILPPTDHGHYTFVGEYHEKIARGVIIVD